ncbi:MAG: isoleucine--tRNA ligase [Planctomycetota bacterium]|jgi:isoleucyl-tRNA synthetase|nr:isoleucine--tRNA ligase [Planctomycetota bacterium]
MGVFKPVDREINFPALELKWLEFWKTGKIFEKQLEQGRIRSKAEGKPRYVFYEGPPTANGMPHPGHVLTRVVKDLFPRFRAMQGYDVPRKAGWDTHGLPVEIEVEKELGIEGKHAIERYGVEPFVKKCKDSVFRYADAWRKMTERIGFWVDMDDPYVTYHESYIESVWWSLKRMWDAGLIYHGHKIVPWCPRCGTVLSSHEVGQGYREVADPSAYVAFRSKDDPKLFYVAWTTTPWTLLSNVALAVGAGFDYDYVRAGDETFVMASALREKVLAKIPHEVVKTVKGNELVGKRYERLFPFATPEKPAFRVVAGDFVGLDAGSGIVHIAPAFGEDDYRMGVENSLPVVNLVNPDGTVVDAAVPYAGKFVKEADPLIIKDLRARGQLVKSEQYVHDYPFCWRCPSPLLYYPRPAWYIRTSTVKNRMLENNGRVRWLPEHIKHGRFGNFLETNVDWALSRERYWGTPLPIWQCSCGNRAAVGGKKELFERATNRHRLPDNFELHKPWVDQVILTCDKCGGEMRRVSEVIDCWYDSGAMHFAQWGYPYAEGSPGRLAGALPADFISEAIDQTRGWFYSLLAIATLLKVSAERKRAAGLDVGDLSPWEKAYPLPYKSCLVLGLLLSEEGTKLSKKLRNYPDPSEVLDNEGADAMRWFFYISNQPWTSTRFFEGGIRETQKDFLVRLRNVLSFFVIYANIDGFNPAEGNPGARELTPAAFAAGPSYVPHGKRPVLDRWMLSKLESVAGEVTRQLEDMNILLAAQALNGLVEQLSNWYVRRSRDRFWASGNCGDKMAAYWTLYESLCRIALLIAPFTPFFAEELYQELGRSLWPETLPESVHLCAWPAADAARVDLSVEERMDLVREIASLGLSARASRKLKVRQPLSRAVVILARPEARRDVVEDLADVVKDEINVKALEFAADAGEYVDFTVKPNFQVLGPELGRDMKACAAALARAPALDVVRALNETGEYAVSFAGRERKLTRVELDVRIAAKEGFAAAGGRGAVVVLDAHVTEELEREGLARELINRIQTFRKELDLPFETRIRVRVGAGGKAARAAVEHADAIAAETLAGDFKVEFEDLGETRAFELAGEPVRVSVAKV